MLVLLRVSGVSSCLALGLLIGCGPTPGSATDSDPASTGPASTPSTGPSMTTDPPTTGTSTSAASTTGTSTSAASTTGGSTDPVLTSTGMTSTTTSEGSSGPASSTGNDTESGCVALMQGFTDPPVPSGWEKCGDQLPHRVSIEVCQVPAAPANCALDSQKCKTNADCPNGPFLSCQENPFGCNCVPGCATDADCEPGQVCRCAGDVLGPTSSCVPSKCKSDADCGDQRCQFAQSEGQHCGLQVIDGSCTTPQDECDSDLPCDFGLFCGAVGENDLWLCQGAICD